MLIHQRQLKIAPPEANYQNAEHDLEHPQYCHGTNRPIEWDRGIRLLLSELDKPHYTVYIYSYWWKAFDQTPVNLASFKKSVIWEWTE